MKSGWSLTKTGRLRRLEAAARLVENIPQEQFHMGVWWSPDGMAYDDWRNKKYRVAVGPCGCALGHITQKRLFGLTPKIFDNHRQRVFVIAGDTFGVSYKSAEFMFDQYAYDPMLPGGGRPTHPVCSRGDEGVKRSIAYQWASYLEQPRLKQTKNILSLGNTKAAPKCCLGHLEYMLGTKFEQDGSGTWHTESGEVALLSEKTRKKAGLYSVDGMLRNGRVMVLSGGWRGRYTYGALSGANDGGLPLKEIAKLIRKYWKEL